MSEPLVVIGNGMAAARFVEELSCRALGRYAIAVVGEERRQDVLPVQPDRPHPGEVVEPDLVDSDALGRDTEQRRQRALEADCDVAEPDRAVPRVEQCARHDPDRVREVDDQRARRRQRAHARGDVEHHGDRPQRLGEAPRPRGLLADAAEPVGEGLIGEAGLLAADPELDEDECGAIDGVIPVGRRAQPARPAEPLKDPSGQPGHDLQPLGVDVVEDELIDRKGGGPDRDAGQRAPNCAEPDLVGTGAGCGRRSCDAATSPSTTTRATCSTSGSRSCAVAAGSAGPPRPWSPTWSISALPW